MVITLKNSAKSNPFENSEQLKTTKENKMTHGFGLKSINKTVNKYNGIIKQSYDNELKMFKTVVLIKITDFENIDDITSLPPDFRTDF